MPVVGEACREWRSIVKCVRLFAFGELDLCLERFDLPPPLQYRLLFFREVDGHADDAQ